MWSLNTVVHCGMRSLNAVVDCGMRSLNAVVDCCMRSLNAVVHCGMRSKVSLRRLANASSSCNLATRSAPNRDNSLRVQLILRFFSRYSSSQGRFLRATAAHFNVQNGHSRMASPKMTILKKRSLKLPFLK